MIPCQIALGNEAIEEMRIKVKIIARKSKLLYFFIECLGWHNDKYAK